MTQAAPPPPKTAREEMWLIILAKSKTMRFFAVSCEFILFLGCLWLTMTTILPSASAWASGTVDNFFLVAMGFAVDAAMPEAWLHVVDQWTDSPRKVMHLRWSISIAIGMSLLVVANVTYSKIAGTSGEQPTGMMEGVVNTLLIARILIGISYVAIRECQSFLDRKQVKQQPAQPTAPDIEQMIAQAMAMLQTDVDQRLTHLADEQAQMQNSLQQMQTAGSAIDQTAIIQAVIEHFSEQFDTAMKRFAEQRVQVSPVNEHPALASRLNTKQRTANTQKIVRLTPRSPGTASHQETIFRLLREDETRGPRELARLAGCSPATAKSYRDLYIASRSERNGTSDERTDETR